MANVLLEARVRRVGRGKILRQFVIETLGRSSNRAQRRAGYPLIAAVPSDAIGREIFGAGYYEEDLLLALFESVLSSSKSVFTRSVAIDVGANIGNHTLFLARRFGTVVSFEPYPPLAKILDANLSLNDTQNVILRAVGLSDRDAEIEYIPGGSGNLGGGGFGAGLALSAAKLLPVRIGDSEIERLNLSLPIALIKVDVEGHEFAALRGLLRTIERFHPFILFEANDPSADGGAVEIYRWLAKIGYRHLYSVGPRWNLPSFVRRRLLRIAGLTQLAIALCRGNDYVLTEVANLENRPYPLLLASASTVEPF